MNPSIYPLSFLRLVGCTYFWKHTSTFQLQTPEALFYSIPATSGALDGHSKWLGKIHSTVCQHLDRESDSMPSTESLGLHWKRCIQHCLTMAARGWKVTSEMGSSWKYWQRHKHLRHKHLQWLKGTSAKGQGSTHRCSCQRKDRICGPSCQCINSMNTCTPTQPSTNQPYAIL